MPLPAECGVKLCVVWEPREWDTKTCTFKPLIWYGIHQMCKIVSIIFRRLPKKGWNLSNIVLNSIGNKYDYTLNYLLQKSGSKHNYHDTEGLICMQKSDKSFYKYRKEFEAIFSRIWPRFLPEHGDDMWDSRLGLMAHAAWPAARLSRLALTHTRKNYCDL